MQFATTLIELTTSNVTLLLIEINNITVLVFDGEQHDLSSNAWWHKEVFLQIQLSNQNRDEFRSKITCSSDNISFKRNHFIIHVSSKNYLSLT